MNNSSGLVYDEKYCLLLRMISLLFQVNVLYTKSLRRPEIMTYENTVPRMAIKEGLMVLKITDGNGSRIIILL